MAFDLDPGEPATIEECCEVALLLRDVLEPLGLRSFPKTSGSKGMQLYVPLNADVTYADTRPLSQALARHLEAQHPKLIVSVQKRELRRGKVLIDWSQNHEKKTTVSVYSLRARERPTVSTPLTWDEVEAGDPDALVFEADEVLERARSTATCSRRSWSSSRRCPSCRESCAARRIDGPAALLAVGLCRHGRLVDRPPGRAPRGGLGAPCRPTLASTWSP